MRIVVALALVLVACGDNQRPYEPPVDPPSGCSVVRGDNILLRQVATLQGEVPLLVTGPAGDRRQFVVEQYGRIVIIDGGRVLPAPFLDLSADVGGPVVIGSERGLLGLAFHPDYETTGTFFVYYTTFTQDVIARFQRLDAEHADPASSTLVMTIDHPRSNHQGGMIEFGSDGLLYIGTGDGGGSGDPDLASGDPFSLLGKLLRIDIDTPALDTPYSIPPANPFADGVAGAPEVFVIGLRNPWRWSFDRANGDLWIGDVGQDLFEELDVISADDAPGADFGWSSFEGESCFRPPCDATGKITPVAVRSHVPDGWCSIIAGAVYRGRCYPDLVGEHVFTDYCAHYLETARRDGGGVRMRRPQVHLLELDGTLIEGSPVTPSSIHADGRDELYLTTVSCCGSSFIGAVYHVEAAP